MRPERTIDRIRDEIWMLCHGGRRGVLGYRRDAMAFYEDLFEMGRNFEPQEQAEFDAWADKNTDGCTVASYCWPGWYERSLRMPPSYGKGEGQGIGAPRSYFAALSHRTALPLPDDPL